jgi:hypothetical protein
MTGNVFQSTSVHDDDLNSNVPDCDDDVSSSDDDRLIIIVEQCGAILTKGKRLVGNLRNEMN